MTAVKRCPRCGETKPLTAFNSDRSRRSGVYPYCQTCHAANTRQDYAKNREARLAARKPRADIIRVINRVYWADEDPHADTTPKRCPECGLDRPRTDFGIVRSARDGLRTYCRSCWSMRCLAREARKRAVYVEDVHRDVVWERDRGLCYLCGHPADPARWDLEHIHPIAHGGEHSYLNTAVSHPLCNQQKGSTPWPSVGFEHD